MLLHQTKTRNWGLIVAICLLAITLGVFAEPVALKLTDGTLWNGEIGGHISLVEKKRNNTKLIEGTLIRDAGQFIVVSTATGNSVVFVSDIHSIETDSQSPATEQATLKAPEQSKTSAVAKPEVQAGKLSKRVFLLPLDGGIGDIIRPTEIREIAEHADQFGPGQIIILDINSPGGSVLTGVQLQELVFDIRKRHRAIAWVDMAISGGAFLAFCCDEIYFKRSANFGSITMWSGQYQGAEEQQMNAWIKQLEGVLAKTSRTYLFAGPMVIVARQLSYDIDSETGEITYYDDLTGKHPLSDGTSVEVLALTANNALDCGLSDGTADTREELAALLDLDFLDDDGLGQRSQRNGQNFLSKHKWTSQS